MSKACATPVELPNHAAYLLVLHCSVATAERLHMQISQTAEASRYMAYYLRSLLGSTALAVDPTSQNSRSCIRSLAKAFIVWSVGKKPPPPVDWARPDEVGRCDRETACERCADLNIFLRDADARKHTMYPGSGGTSWDYDRDYDHLKQCFDSIRSGGLRCGIEKQDEGPGLFFIKTTDGWSSKHKRWESGRDSVRCDLVNLPQL